MVALDVAGRDLRESAARKSFLPVSAIALVVGECANAALRPLHHVVDMVGEQGVAAADAFWEETAFGNFGFALCVNFFCECFRSDLFAVFATAFIVVAHPPHAGAFRALEDAAIRARSLCGALVGGALCHWLGT
ncbi:MAG TPA: hypothetical protein VN634_02420 [Candidatus Limnocylindrales bacterium]|nr:hypothetical protein [Candidatus Limnocylindrales bacterium]